MDSGTLGAWTELGVAPPLESNEPRGALVKMWIPAQQLRAGAWDSAFLASPLSGEAGEAGEAETAGLQTDSPTLPITSDVCVSNQKANVNF